MPSPQTAALTEGEARFSDCLDEPGFVDLMVHSLGRPRDGQLGVAT
jgi:hypothetical protein